MTNDDIISRAAYDIGDPFFKDISKDEWLKMLRRVYRDFCEETKILRNAISFTTTTAKSYKLYGLDQNGNPFGDNFLGIYRAEYNDLKAYEVDFDTLKITTVGLGSDIDETTIVYTIQYNQDSLWVCFAHTPTTGDTFKIWYYELPRITSLAALADSPLIDKKYHDKLVEGLTVAGWYRKFLLSIQNKEGSMMTKVYKTEYTEKKTDWMITMKKVHQEVMAFKDDTIPLQMLIGTPFDLNSFDDMNTEISDTAI